jgi:hypothetical protein
VSGDARAAEFHAAAPPLPAAQSEALNFKKRSKKTFNEGVGMIYNGLKFGDSLPAEGYWEAEVKGYDTWASQFDPAKHGVRALVALINSSYDRDISVLEDSVIAKDGLIAQMVAAARGKPIDYQNEKPEEVLPQAIGKRVYVLIKHRKRDNKVFPNVNDVRSLADYEAIKGSIRNDSRATGVRDSEWPELMDAPAGGNVAGSKVADGNKAAVR